MEPALAAAALVLIAAIVLAGRRLPRRGVGVNPPPSAPKPNNPPPGQKPVFPRTKVSAFGTPECGWCGGETDAEFVDVGVGLQQVTHAVCACGAMQIGAYDASVYGRVPDDEEKRRGFYRPAVPEGKPC